MGMLTERKLKKKNAIKRVITGTDQQSEDRRILLKSKIKQFSLPANVKPEVYIKDLIIQLNDEVNIMVPDIKSVGIQADHHDYLDVPIAQSGRPRSVALYEITNILSSLPQWDGYVAEISNWLEEQKGYYIYKYFQNQTKCGILKT